MNLYKSREKEKEREHAIALCVGGLLQRMLQKQPIKSDSKKEDRASPNMMCHCRRNHRQTEQNRKEGRTK